MEEIKIMNNIGYTIGERAKLEEFEILRLLEFIRYDQHYDFLKQVISIGKSVKISIPDKLFQYNHCDFEDCINALWEGLFRSCNTLKVESNYKLSITDI